MSEVAERPAVGWIGLGDQGLPMAVAVAEAGFQLHAWARRPGSLDALGSAQHVRHDDIEDLAAASDIVCLCVSTDDDVIETVTGGLLKALRPGSVVVNHGTGTPHNALRLTEACAAGRVDVLDAPVSGGRPAALEHRLTTMVGGQEAVARRCEPVFGSFSRHVVYLGGAGSGQAAKLFNNALMIMNHASIAEVIEVVADFGLDPVRLVEVLKLGSAFSVSLSVLNTMVTPETVDHLAELEEEDMKIFATAMTEAGVNADAVTARGLAGARMLPELIRRLNR